MPSRYILYLCVCVFIFSLYYFSFRFLYSAHLSCMRMCADTNNGNYGVLRNLLISSSEDLSFLNFIKTSISNSSRPILDTYLCRKFQYIFGVVFMSLELFFALRLIHLIFLVIIFSLLHHSPCTFISLLSTQPVVPSFLFFFSSTQKVKSITLRPSRPIAGAPRHQIRRMIAPSFRTVRSAGSLN